MDYCRIKVIKTKQISLSPNFWFVLKSIYLQCDSSVFLSNRPLFQSIVVCYTKILFVLASCHAAEEDIFKSNYLKIVQEAWSNVKISTCHLCYKIISVISTCQLLLRSQIKTVICTTVTKAPFEGESIHSSEALRPLFPLRTHLISLPPLSAVTVG